MSVKLKLISIMSAFILMLGMLFVGVYAASQNINLKGTVNFDIGDTALYVKDVRIKDPNTLSGQGTTVEGFMPGYVNTNFNLDLGTVTSSSGTFTLYIDVINTTTSRYIVTTPSSISNATLSVSGTIKGDGVPITELATHENLSGTIEITVVANSTPATINLDEIELTLEEKNYYDVSITIDSSVTFYVLADYNGTSQTYTITKSQDIRVTSVLYIAYKNENLPSTLSVNSLIEPRIGFGTIYYIYANRTLVGEIQVANNIDQDVTVKVYDNNVITTSVEGKTLKCEITQDVDITITTTQA